MKILLAVIIVFSCSIVTFLLLARFSYMGPRTEIGIIDGPDVNVPYHDKYGLLGYAYARDYYQNGRIVERRIELLSPLKLTISSLLVSGVWMVAGLLFCRIFKRETPYGSAAKLKD